MTIWSSLLRSTVLPWALARDDRQSALSHWRRFEESQYWSSARLQDYQQQKLSELLKHAYTTSPYYRRIFD